VTHADDSARSKFARPNDAEVSSQTTTEASVPEDVQNYDEVKMNRISRVILLHL
jgi:hypothetical protein